MKILLLEDDFNLADAIKEILEIEGYDVDVANNAEEAYELTYNNKYDLYIFDINLPDENGFEVLKNLKNADDNTPTIYISAMTDLSTMSKAFKIGAQDYIKKPFEVEELLLRIQAKYNQLNETIQIGKFTYNPQTKELRENDKILSIGGVLKSILDLLIQHKNNITPKSELLDIVDYNDASLRVHINKLKKLGFDIKNIRGEGYVLEV